MRALLFCILPILLHVCHFCSGENHKEKELSVSAARQRLERLTDKLISKFVRKEEKLSKLFVPEKGIKEDRDTKDVNLLKYIAAISGFHSASLHKKSGKNSEEALQHNKRAIFKFIARIYTMIMDAPINKDGKRFLEFEPLFAQLKALREKVEKEDKNHKHLDLAPAPMQKGESVYQIFFMPKKALADIKSNNLHNYSIKDYSEAYEGIVKVMNFISDVLKPNDKNGHNDIFANPEKFQELLKNKVAREMATKDKNTTTKLSEIFRTLASNAGYDVKKVTGKEKLKSKLVKMLTDLYLSIWNSHLYDDGTYKDYGKIYNNLMIVKDYYIKDHNMDWEKELKEAKEDLHKRLKESERYGVSQEWSWIYASDSFWDEEWRKENEKNENLDVVKRKQQQQNEERSRRKKIAPVRSHTAK